MLIKDAKSIITKEYMPMQMGTLLMILGLLIIAGGGFLVHYGNKLNQQSSQQLSEQKILEQQKESEKAVRGDIKEQTRILLERMQSQDITSYEILSKRYPKGYYLFASNRYIVIPSNKETKEKFALDWSKSKVQFIDGSFIYITLEHFYYYPNEIEVANLNIVLERKVGSIADGIYFDNIGLCVEVLDERTDEVIYVIGFKDVQSIPKVREENPQVGEIVNRLGIGPLVSAINTQDKKFIRIKDWTIASGWKIIQQ